MLILGLASSIAAAIELIGLGSKVTASDMKPEKK